MGMASQRRAQHSEAFRSRRPCRPPGANWVALCTFIGQSTCATEQTSKPISATRPPTRAGGDSPDGRKNHHEVPDYSVFVAWACRLLLHWPLYRPRSGFKRLRRFGGHPYRPVVPSTYPDSTKIVPIRRKGARRARSAACCSPPHCHQLRSRHLELFGRHYFDCSAGD